MNEAALLAWCVPLALASLSILFFALGRSVRGAASWGIAYALAASGFALALVPAERWIVVKAVSEDALLLFAVMAMARGISLRFRRPPHDRAAAGCALAMLFLTAAILTLTRDIETEIAIVQTGCAGFSLFAARQMWGKLKRTVNRVLFFLAFALAITLIAQTIYITFADEVALTLTTWRDTRWSFIFQLSGITFGLAFAFTALIAIGMDAVDGYRRKSEKDELSGLFNRSGFQARVRQAVAVPAGAGALIVIDIDHFKTVNDTYGHAAGDMVIAGMGTLLNSLARQGFSGRIGGEEFAVFITGADGETATRHANDIKAALTAFRWPAPWRELSITASYGIAIRRPGDTMDTLYRRADQRLYDAKTGGRDRIVATDATIISMCEHPRSDRQSPPLPPSPAIRDACAP